MPNVLKSLLIGIGFKIDEKTTEGANAAVDALGSKVTKLGGLVAGAFGVREMKNFTTDLAQAEDDLGKFANRFGMIPNQVRALGNALGTENGSMQELIGELSHLYDLRNQFHIKGSAGFIKDLGLAGVSQDDVSKFLHAKDAVHAYLAAADMLAKLPQGRRIAAGQALGLGQASIALMSGGSAPVEKMMKRFENMRPLTDQMTKTAADFDTNMHTLDQNLSHFSDLVGNELIKSGSDMAAAMNNWIDHNRPWLDREATTLGKVPGAIEMSAKYYLSGEAFGDLYNSASHSALSAIHHFSQPPAGHAQGNSYSGTVKREPPEAPLRPEGHGAPLVIHLENSMDGQVFERKIIQVTENENRKAIDDLSNSEAH